MDINLKSRLAPVYVATWRMVTSYVEYGVNVFDHDWDVLIILDACRTDALQKYQNNYEYIDSIKEVTSIGSTSTEWVHNTFINKHLSDIQNTAYVTANPFSDHVKSGKVNRLRTLETIDTWAENNSIIDILVKNNSVAGEFQSFEKVDGIEIDTESGSTTCFPPDLVTAKAIEISREREPDRLIVHYMQPHTPYISEAIDRGKLYEYENSPFNYLKGGGDKSLVWDSYLKNLEIALDSVETLLCNIDSDKTVITADHGELFGEWGLHSHIYGIPHPNLRSVPWVETTAENRQRIDPTDFFDKYQIKESDKISTDDQLEVALSLA